MSVRRTLTIGPSLQRDFRTRKTLEESAFRSSMVSECLSDEEDSFEDQNPRETPGKEILWAAEHGKLELVQKLASENKELLKYSDEDGYTALHRAAYSNQPDIVRWLLDQGADMCSRTNDKWTPFHSACYWNNVRAVSMLLSLRMDINVRTANGITGLHLAAGNCKARESLLVLLSHPQIDVDLKNAIEETAYTIAQRSGPLHYLFEMAEPCFNYL